MRDDDDKMKGFVLRLRGLPYSATEDDVRVFFKDIEISKEKNAIVIALAPGDKKPLGEAYVEFFSEGAYMEALQRNKQKMGERYIELFPSSRGELKQQLHNQQGGRRAEPGFIRGSRGRQQPGHQVSIFPQSVPGVASLSGPQAATDGSTIKLRGLPFSATVDDIIQFFEGNNLSACRLRYRLCWYYDCLCKVQTHLCWGWSEKSPLKDSCVLGLNIRTGYLRSCFEQCDSQVWFPHTLW